MGQRWMMSSKIHKAVSTQAEPGYIGSITIDEDLLDKVGLLVHERVLVVSITSGARLETYTLAAPRGSRTICINGAAARLIGVGEELIIMGFQLSDGPNEPKAILVDSENNFVQYL